MALLLSCGSEQGRVDFAGGRIETQSQVGSIERPQWVIQEVGPVEAELQLFRFLELEVLEESQIGVEESRSVDGREYRRAVLTDLRWWSETTRIDELILP